MGAVKSDRKKLGEILSQLDIFLNPSPDPYEMPVQEANVSPMLSLQTGL